MIRSMWSAVSGLRSHQIYLDVTGNNIANVNTHGFKSSRAIFEDSLSQIARQASGPTQGGGTGGTNPAQIGLGVRLGQISGNFTQGALQVTNVPTDLAIQGDGFFVVKNGAEQMYTRSGAFCLDAQGNLVTSDGSYVQGFMGDTAPTFDATTGAVTGTPTNITIDASKWQSYQIGQDGRISGVQAGDTTGTLKTIGQLVLSKFNNPPGLERVGGTMFRASLNAGAAVLTLPGNAASGIGTISSGTLEMSNVDLASEFTNLIIAQRGFQANSRVVTASDEVLQDLINMKR